MAVSEDGRRQRAVVGVGRVEFGKAGPILGAELFRGLAAEGRHQVLVRVQGDDGDASLAGKVQQIAVVIEIHAPVLAPARLLQEGLLVQQALNPPVECRLLGAGEHLHAEGLAAGVAFGEGLQELHLQAVRGGVVMGFAEIDDARIAGNGEHLRLADEGAGRQVHDIADFGRVCGG